MNDCDEKYNVPEGIAEYLTRGLRGLNELVADRRAAYERKEQLDRFVILRTWVLDGNYIGTLEKPLGEVFPDVVRVEECDRNITWTATYGPTIPTEDDFCIECKKHWTLENAKDVLFFRDSKAFHKGCYQTFIERQERESFAKCFKEAGLTATFESTPNQYCPCDICGPWFLAMTEIGVIKLGWRKRVVNIDWNAIANGPDGNALFREEHVTTGPRNVHAWNYEKVTEYLRAIKNGVSGG